jgi:hypothetical protein
MNYLPSIRVITRPKKSGLATHWGVQLPDGLVVDYTQGVGLRIVTFEGFSEGLPVSVVREVPMDMHWTIRERLDSLSSSPRRYDLLNWNCETFAEWLTAGVPKSEQVAGGLFVFALTVALVIAARS